MFDVTLTFDNGPEPEVTPRVLDELARRSIRATFFVMGRKLATHEGRKVAERAHAEGHWIGNHTWSHTVPLGRRSEPDVAETEIGRTETELGALAHPDRYFRPFGGGGNLDRRLLSPSALEFLARGRFTCVLWNVVPRDWDDPEGWVDRALGEIRTRPWSLVVLHDLPSGAAPRLGEFIDRAGQAGALFRQDFPPDCAPIVRGEIVGEVTRYISQSPG